MHSPRPLIHHIWDHRTLFLQPLYKFTFGVRRFIGVRTTITWLCSYIPRHRDRTGGRTFVSSYIILCGLDLELP
jgi:hypothetical protein